MNVPEREKVNGEVKEKTDKIPTTENTIKTIHDFFLKKTIKSKKRIKLLKNENGKARFSSLPSRSHIKRIFILTFKYSNSFRCFRRA